MKWNANNSVTTKNGCDHTVSAAAKSPSFPIGVYERGRNNIPKWVARPEYSKGVCSHSATTPFPFVRACHPKQIGKSLRLCNRCFISGSIHVFFETPDEPAFEVIERAVRVPALRKGLAFPIRLRNIATHRVPHSSFLNK